ncbi:2-oxoglutarate dehydrogenase [Mangrovimonas yunxiaonensis]|uniref:Dihydrolipoamide acetyltransferase component of pyruvate dehydrogenase complex n=1 Tax=Mangrovimonas yunxiaonensis TaxID=1197477 RepID=A0A084TP08_9FLAO|nr:dihydrolipoamide acetyltransferase family protein [Mangrovimonas yunxiaonensis]KFB02444.1 2-oxoglutarate dehydrogenase [Mangrovimonas yunxiaonensis]GGH40399.1 dihydrolipoamide acetyltransferase component of pyruvate dehydrogenase complex [Mangrovimonas yunxiaonensis]
MKDKEIPAFAGSYELKMPKMGESITEGTIINWLVAEGDSFDEGDILLEVATDKVDNEVPAPASGTLVKTMFQAKDVVPVGQVIAVLEVSEEVKSSKKSDVIQSDSEASQKAKKQVKKKRTAITNKTEASHLVSSSFTVSNEDRFFSPLIISIAKQHHISFEELARIPATGNEGRLRKSDVFNYIEDGRPYQFAQPVAQDPTAYRIPQLTFDKGKGKIVEMDRMRQMIADHMVYSKHTSPHVTAYVEADLTNMVNWRNNNKVAFQEKYGEKLTFTPLFVEAVAKAVKDFPNINASVDGNNIIVKDNINIGMATALPSGNLIVPVVKNADTKDLKTLAENVNELAGKARDNKLSGDDIKGSTFTISNVGTFGSVMGTPIINQPEVAILALGIIKKRAEVIETEKGDEIAIRSMMYLSLSFDHRVVDGYLGGSFVRRVADYLEQFDTNRKI